MSEAIIAKKAELVDVVAENESCCINRRCRFSRVWQLSKIRILPSQPWKRSWGIKLLKTQSCVVQLKSWSWRSCICICWTICSSTFSNEDVIAPAKILNDFAKRWSTWNQKVVQSKALSHLKEEILALATLPNREGLFLCSFLYFRRQCATLLLQSKRLQTTKKTQLNLKLRSVA